MKLTETRNFLTLFAAVCLALILLQSGCASTQNSDGKAKPKIAALAHKFNDIPVPIDFDLDQSKSFVYESGSGRVKVGRLIYTGWGKKEEVVHFYENEMPVQGWKLVNTVQQDAVMMNFQKRGWVATVTINSSWPNRATVEIQVGPK